MKKIIDNIILMKKNLLDFEQKVLIYNIRLFSLQLNIFLKYFRYISYDSRLEQITILQQEYLKYLKNIYNINKIIVISQLHPIYITPLLLKSDITETITLTDNVIVSRQLSNYFSSISPEFIQFNVKLLTANIRDNLLGKTEPIVIEDLTLANPLDQVRPVFEKTYDGTLFFYPDYRNKTYEIEVEAYSILISHMKYKFIVVENGFPVIKPNVFTDSNIKLSNLNNTFELDFRNYYSDSNILFMVYSISNISKTLSNLTYEDKYIYVGSVAEDYNIPTITDYIIITPYLKGYPVLNEEYSNTPVTLSITTCPKITYNTAVFNFTDRTPYYYDLMQINEWYINVNTLSSVTIDYGDTRPRQNLKIIDKETIINDSNLLYIYPDYRNGTYNVNIIIETINDYALSNIIEMTITEGPAPKPVRTIRNLLLKHLLINEELVFNANNYFSTNTNEILNYDYSVSNIYDHVNNVKLNTLPDNTFKITSSNLKFTPSYRNISYDLYVYAIDSVYYVRSDDNLILNVREDKILNKIDELYNQYGLGNDIMEIDINNHLNLPTDSDVSLNYTVSVDKDLRINKNTDTKAIYIDNNILKIDPDFRNDSYNVTVYIEAFESATKVDSTNFIFSVSESVAPYPTIKTTSTLLITDLTTFTRNIDLNRYFLNDITDSSTQYSSTQYSSADSDYYSINGNNLVIIPNVRNMQYNISILATDNTYGTYKTESNLLNIVVNESPPIKLLPTNNSIAYELTDTGSNIDLNTIFSSLVSLDTLRYYVFIETNENEDIRLNVATYTQAYGIDNNILKLYPDYRGLKYKLIVTAINLNYIAQPVTYYIDITEAEKLLPNMKLDSFDINVAYFSYYKEDTLSIDLEKLFTHLKYYPNYIIRLSSDIFKLEKFINIRLGYLVISKFDLTFNFKINVFLFDVIENKKVNTEEITINFKHNVQTLRFINSNNCKITLSEINENYRYNIKGLDGVILNDNMVTLNNSTVTVFQIQDPYQFVIEKFHIALELVVTRIIYKVDNNLVYMS